MQWEKRWGNFNWQNVSRHMQSTDHIYRSNQCIVLFYMFIQKQTKLHIFYKYIYDLDHFHEKFIVCYTTVINAKPHWSNQNQMEIINIQMRKT